MIVFAYLFHAPTLLLGISWDQLPIKLLEFPIYLKVHFWGKTNQGMFYMYKMEMLI